VDISDTLRHLFVGSAIVAGVAFIGVAAALTLLLGSLPWRKIGLRLLWISVAILTASLLTLLLIYTN
jgi:hypothetical protein